jgi:glyceraldehyde-3-phosphate dehydrogenase (NAD(P))
MAIRVSVIGYDLIGKRIADAVLRQEDMVVHGVFEDDPCRREIVARNGFALLLGSREHLDVGGDIAVLCRDDCNVSGVPVVHGAHMRSTEGVLVSPLTSPDQLYQQACLRIALPDTIALGRIVQVITPLARIERLFGHTIVRAGHATESSDGSVDALEPLPEDPAMKRQVAEAFGSLVPRCQIRQVRAPYTHSHLHIVKLDLDRQIGRQQVLAVLRGTPRVLLGAAADGFATTADIQEYFRNSTRSRGDHPETFVWEESIITQGRQLMLMMNVCQESTSVLETIDAIRLQQTSADGSEARRQTDEALDVEYLMQPTIRKQLTGGES